MSRCFPYPPPGHTLSKASNEALIESIKLQNLKEAKEQKKKEKREKKEKRKEKKERKKEKKEKKEKTSHNLDKSDCAKVDISKSIWTDTKGDCLHKTIESESEQLERSSLTEENGQPICFRSSSSDSTENSNKRKRHSSSLDGTRSQSKIILVRLPSKKLDGVLPLKEQQLNSTSGRVENTRNKDVTSLRDQPTNYPLPLEGTRKAGQNPTLKTDRQGICSTSGRTEDLPPVKIRKSVPSHIQKLDSLYQDLVVNWVPTPLDDASLYPEVDLLYPDNENQDTRDVKKPKLENDNNIMSCSGSSVVWSKAKYLNDADIYALPYVVPF